jgi:hypothetical protein
MLPDNSEPGKNNNLKAANERHRHRAAETGNAEHHDLIEQPAFRARMEHLACIRHGTASPCELCQSNSWTQVRSYRGFINESLTDHPEDFGRTGL